MSNQNVVGPFCSIQPPVPTQNDGQPLGPQYPAIPNATDLASALAAIAAMRQIIQGLINQLNNNNQTVGRQWGFKTKQPDPKQDNNFLEVQRVQVDKTVTDPNSGASITFKQTSKLVMKDKKTGQQWIYEAGS
jgi:hypothetical protein